MRAAKAGGAATLSKHANYGTMLPGRASCETRSLRSSFIVGAMQRSRASHQGRPGASSTRAFAFLWLVPSVVSLAACLLPAPNPPAEATAQIDVSPAQRLPDAGSEASFDAGLQGDDSTSVKSSRDGGEGSGPDASARSLPMAGEASTAKRGSEGADSAQPSACEESSDSDAGEACDEPLTDTDAETETDPCAQCGGFTCNVLEDHSCGQWNYEALLDPSGISEGPNATDAVVPDIFTRLIWERGANDCGVGASMCLWEQAKRYCAQLSLAEKDQWRLPTVLELLSTMDLETHGNATAVALTDHEGKGYWTSERYALDLTEGVSSPRVWYVNSYHGSVDITSATKSNPVRCVHALSP